MQNKLIEAIQYGATKSKGQKRKHNKRDYFEDHPMRLLSRVANDPFLEHSSYAMTTIVLHDVVEDATQNDTDAERDILYAEINVQFGEVVADGVFDLTNEYTKKRYPGLNRATRLKLEFERLSEIGLVTKLLKLHDRSLNLDDTFESGDISDRYAKESLDLWVALGMGYAYPISCAVREKALRMGKKAKKKSKK